MRLITKAYARAAAVVMALAALALSGGAGFSLDGLGK